ncbi:hypothetical protein MMC12_002174 [Toensbergia leucococca]|nr:hypothetical protein [Toensbergia leucococca]
MASIATLPRLSRERLSSFLLSHSPPSIAIVDVRDEDYVGGHISTSFHVPSSSLDYRIPEIVRTFASKEIVVFHCALSQQRGPSAALRYLREREKKVKKHEISTMINEDQNLGPAEGVLQRGSERGDWAAKQDYTGSPVEGSLKGQEIYVLDGGFVRWQEKYGRDERLTKAYAADLWADYC